jgi:hypothetical protein
VTFAKKSRRFDPSRTRFVLPPLVASPMLRLFAFGLIALVGAVYALVRHYTIDLPPMRVPVTPPPAATYDADAGEIPVPDIYRGEGGAP